MPGLCDRAPLQEIYQLHYQSLPVQCCLESGRCFSHFLASCLTTCKTSLCSFQFSLPTHHCLTLLLVLHLFSILLPMLPYLQTPSPCQLGGPRPALLVLLLPRLLLRLVSQSLYLLVLTPVLYGGLFVPKLLPQPLLPIQQPSLPRVLCLFLLSPPSPWAPKKAPYNPLIKSLEPEKGSFFWKGFPVPLPFLPGSPNPFWVSLKGSKAGSNPFKERVLEPSLNNNGGEAEWFLQAEVRDFTSQNVFLAMEVDKLKEPLESAGRVPKRLCRGSF